VTITVPSSVATKSAIFHLQETIKFYRNAGYSGGALAFHRDIHCESKWAVKIENSMILNPHTSVYIVNNTAVQYGDGILADDECTMGRYCFFQTDNLKLSYTQMDVRVVMESNRAGRAGDAIFGGCLNYCNLAILSHHHWMTRTPKHFLSLFQIRGETQSEIAASPQKICFCDGDQKKVNVRYNYHCSSKVNTAHLWGETFHGLCYDSW